MVENFSDPGKAEITADRIPVGEFVDIEKPSYEKLLQEKMSQLYKQKTK